MSWVTRLQNNQIIVINGIRIQMKAGNRIAVLDEAEIVKLPLEEAALAHIKALIGEVK